MAEFTKEQMAQIQSACAEHIANCLTPLKLPNMDVIDEFATAWWHLETDQPIQTAVEEGTMSCFALAVLNRFCRS